MKDIGGLRHCPHSEHHQEEDDEVGIDLRLDVLSIGGLFIVQFLDKDNQQDIGYQHARSYPQPCAKGEMRYGLLVDVGEHRQQEHRGEVGQSVPSGGQTRRYIDNPLDNLQDDRDDDGANQDVVGCDALRIDELCLCQDFPLQEEQVAEREKHKQKSAGVSDESCGLLFWFRIIAVHFYSAFLRSTTAERAGM